jgi:hypothetical protein
MRASIDPKDPGFDECLRHGLSPVAVEVHLNGEKADMVQTADEDAGLIIRTVYVNGQPKYDPAADEFEREVIYGKVELFLISFNGRWEHPGVPRPADISKPLRLRDALRGRLQTDANAATDWSKHLRF